MDGMLVYVVPSQTICSSIDLENIVGDNGNAGEAGGMTARVFSPSGVPGWRLGSFFQSQHDGTSILSLSGTQGKVRGKPKTATRLEYSLPHASRFGGNKQFSTQNPLMQQFNSHSSTMLSQGGLGGAYPASPNTVTSAQQHQPLMSTSSQDTATDSVQNVSLIKNVANEEDPKVAYESDMWTGASGFLTEPAQTSRDVDLNGLAASLGGTPISLQYNLQMLEDAFYKPQPRDSERAQSYTDVWTFPSSLIPFCGNYEQQYNLQMLEDAFYKLPQPRDSERAHSYTAVWTFPSSLIPFYFWERLGSDNIAFGTDTLLFAFYYQQNPYE
uniref:Uncharacterized protein n=1 Tax=Tanacetum cinerariifolium TaxID=118510 RepID=A0A6L2LX20_TANCI|nr:hypothetical protein [Tanacetum cinerariifolium]